MHTAIETQLPIGRERTKSAPSIETDSSRSNSVAGRATTTGTSTRPQRHVRTAGAPYAKDAEGTEDIYKELLKTLGAHKDSRKGIEDDIREPNSIDWRAEHSWTPLSTHDWPGIDLVQRTLTAIEHQHAFVPRVGELVLFCPMFLDQHYLMLDESTQEYKFYSFDQKCFHGFPTWRAGVITAIPSATGADGSVDFPDIQDLPKKIKNLNINGFRVETFPDPNDEDDKTASKQYRYLPLRNIRPLSHWQILLRGIAREKWHPSVEHALTCMTSISLLEKFYFKGDWDRQKTSLGKDSTGYATIRCKGIYIGAELITIGDAARIAPRSSHRKSRKGQCTDVVIVESIRLHLVDVKSEHILADSPLLASQMYITLVGKGYTLDKNSPHRMQATNNSSSQTGNIGALSPDEIKTIFRPVGAATYGSWYPLHPPHCRFEVSSDQVLGRMCEAGAVQLWTGLLQRKSDQSTKPSLDFDLKGIEEGRAYATQADGRLDDSDQDSLLWFWADTRAEALDLQTFNGIEVGKYDKIRDAQTLELWKAQLAAINGHQASLDSFAAQYRDFSKINLDSVLDGTPGGARRGRPAGTKVVNGKLYRPGDPEYDEIVRGDRGRMDSTPSRHKGSQLAGAALVSTDEDEADDDVEDVRAGFGIPPDRSPARPAIHKAKPAAHQKKPKTKTEIMASAADDESISSDDEWVNYPPQIRGGTEETEGGDYDPRAQD